ncbi:MAG: hypothetical protein ACK5M3_09925 [Dysgonomonas sp.]
MTHSLRINKPNLRTAKTVTIIAAILQLFTSQLLLSIIGLEWLIQISLVYITTGLMQIWAYYYFCQYLRNFNLQKIVITTYITMSCMAAAFIFPMLNSVLFSHGLYYLTSFLSTGLFIINFAGVAALYIGGINLFRFQEDIVGGLSLTGKLFTAKGTLTVLGVLYYVYYYITFYGSRNDYNSLVPISLSMEHLINTLTTVLNISILASFVHIYNNAEEYTMYANYGDDSDILNEINDIGTN